MWDESYKLKQRNRGETKSINIEEISKEGIQQTDNKSKRQKVLGR